MQQVVDLQKDPAFRSLGIVMLSISPDSVASWRQEGGALGITTPMLSDQGAKVAFRYGVMRWMMPTGEPGHTFVLVDRDGRVAWVKDYGAPEHGGVMYVAPPELVSEIKSVLQP